MNEQDYLDDAYDRLRDEKAEEQYEKEIIEDFNKFSEVKNKNKFVEEFKHDWEKKNGN